MPRRNRRYTPPPTSKHALDRWMRFCEEMIVENGKEMSAVVDTPTPIKSPPQRILNNRKKGGKSHD